MDMWKKVAVEVGFEALDYGLKKYKQKKKTTKKKTTTAKKRTTNRKKTTTKKRGK
jgi:hypothetical protein